MKKKHFGWLVSSAILLGVVWLTPERLCAQVGEAEHGRVEIGIRQLFGDRASSKFNEYRDIPQGFFIRHSEVHLDDLLNKTFFVNFQTRDTLENDQTYLLGLGVYRKYRFDLRWDQTPHDFTNTAKSFLLESSPGVFTAPATLRSVLQSQPGNLQAVLDSARPLDMSLRRDTGAGTFAYTPTSNWTLQLQYSREKQVGHRPFGTTTNSFTNTEELPEPIDYRTHQVMAGTEYANKRGGFQAKYSGSIFNNEVSTLVWDIPFRTTDAANASSRGRLDLYPHNTANNLSFAGIVKIPHATRFMASIVPGWMRQNDAFLPLTINTAITGLPELPATSLHGSRQTLAMNYTLTSKAIRAVPLTLRYRSYDYNNNTPSLTFSRLVITDSSVTSASFPRRSLPFGYNRKTLGLDASWQFVKNSSLKFLYNWERMDREHRDVHRSHEHTVGTVFDFNPRNWLLFRASYKHSERNPEEYEANEESFPLGEAPTTLGQIKSLRKFDEAARGRHRAEALLQLTPVDQFSFGASYGTTQDSYDATGCTWLGFRQCYGLLKDINFNYTFDVTYTPRRPVSFYAEYTREKNKYRQRSRSRLFGIDSPNNDWESNRRDLVDTWAAGVDASLSNKVILNVFYSLSVAKNKISTGYLQSTSYPGPLPPFTTAGDYPDTSNRWHQLVASLRFPLKAGFTPRFEYRYEKYDRIDFQLQSIGQYNIPDLLGVFLGVGADVPGYKAHIVAVSLEYRF